MSNLFSQFYDWSVFKLLNGAVETNAARPSSLTKVADTICGSLDPDGAYTSRDEQHTTTKKPFMLTSDQFFSREFLLTYPEFQFHTTVICKLETSKQIQKLICFNICHLMENLLFYRD